MIIMRWDAVNDCLIDSVHEYMLGHCRVGYLEMAKVYLPWIFFR
jgi:hypothetical protein